MVEGSCDHRFAAVRAAFERNFTEHGEVGAAVAVIVDGTVVVDLHGGWADPERRTRWRADTLVNAYSVGKAFLAALALREVERGRLELDRPVAADWPEFGVGGKAEVTVREALSHRAGVPAIRERLTNDDLWDFERMCDAVAATERWSTGPGHVYHTNTYGHLVGGLLHRVTGRRPGRLLAEAAGPVGADVHWGLAERDLGRCATVVWQGPDMPAADDGNGDRHEGRSDGLDGLDDTARMVMLGYVNPPGYSSIGVVNSTQWRSAEIPSTNGHMTALGIARMYAAMLDGSLLAPGTLAEAVRPQSSGPCPVLGQEATFGLGLQPWTPARPFGRTPAGFGHYGTGGSLGYADPTLGLAVGYVMNRVIPRWQSPCNRALVDAIHASIDQVPPRRSGT